ncbi:MAG: SMP-30/gluconolactonase/LRE family protein [Rhodoferax sp.]|nr:SMP-30/gluconolactonase/LRE family protein [Rhodoferax sp.]
MSTPTSPPAHPWQTVAPHAAALGESPFWHPLEQRLYWLDIASCQVLRANLDMDTVEAWPLPCEPGCMAPAASGGLVLALRDGIYRARSWGGALTRLATLDYNPAHMRANDGKCDALGRFWVGTIDETRQAHNAALYCVDARPSQGAVPQVSCKISPSAGMTTANGLAWSPDQRTLYWADTPSHTVWAWDFDLASASMTQQRVFAHFDPKPAGWQPAPSDAGNGGYRGRPDGATVDAQGNYWVAMFEGRRVCQFSPSGALLAELATPLQCPTMPCLGGEDFKTLYLTSARHHRSAPELAAYPLSGQVLAQRVAVAGLPVAMFVD